jgi:hypothetical protein
MNQNKQKTYAQQKRGEGFITARAKKGAAQAHGGCGVRDTAQQVESLANMRMRVIDDNEMSKGVRKCF